MKYNQIHKGIFIARPNRFIAVVAMDGKEETVHVKNTGRCMELLQEGTEVFLEEAQNPKRKTRFDLIAVRKGNRIVNMDSSAPNKAVQEWLEKGGLFQDIRCIKPEAVFGKSRFDFYIETGKDKIFMEVKGVNLEQENVVSFPDAPSERALKHVGELITAKKQGYQAYILFVIQMRNVDYFIPNAENQPAFAKALREAEQEGVKILAYDCEVGEDAISLCSPVEVRLQNGDNEMRLRRIPEPLLKWYDCSHRILPWREDAAPYRVWISEIMLQQTRVEAVKPYFERFMKELPDIKSLAEAPEEKLLKLWEGLGYYNRVRNLQKAALRIQEEYGGQMPQEYETLMKLPGIGSYTAGAVASIAFGQKKPAVDGNVLRVAARVCADGSDILDTKVKKRMEREILQIMPGERPGDFNQAMMELGAVVCVPNGAPKCKECPLYDICKARTEGSMLDYPKKASKKPRKTEEKTVLVIQDGSRIAIRKRPDKGLLAGMYELPMLEGHMTQEEVIRYLEKEGLKILRIKKLENAKHIFTHREWHMIGYTVRVDELAEKKKQDFLFIEPAQTKDNYPIPSAFAAYAKYIKLRLGNGRFQEEQ